MRLWTNAMTKTKAAAVVAAIVNAGFECRAIKIATDSWTVRSTSPNIDVDIITVVAPFITAQAITGLVSEVEYS
jgi:hypothetical protein